MTDYWQDAVDAVNSELKDYSAVCGAIEYEHSTERIEDGDAAEFALRAAEPHLHKKWLEELLDEITSSRYPDKESVVERMLKYAG